jgi:hypothetical protein
MAEAKKPNLESFQKLIGYRFGNHKLLQTALKVKLCENVDRHWLITVGQSSIATVLCRHGPGTFAWCSSDDGWSLVADNMGSVDEEMALAVLGAICVDYSPKKKTGVLASVFEALFDLPTEQHSKAFVVFHNTLHNGTIEAIERCLIANPDLVYWETSKGFNPLMLVVQRRRRYGNFRLFRDKDWKQVKLLLRYGATWGTPNDVSSTAGQLMRRCQEVDVQKAVEEFGLVLEQHDLIKK